MYMTRIMLKRVPPPNIIHGILSAAFPGQRNNRVNENLWRIDKLGDDRALMIVSEVSPDQQRIVEEIGADRFSSSHEKSKTLDYGPFLECIKNDQIWHFRLCANPVEHKKQHPDDKRGKIFALRYLPEQLEWLDRQGTKNGFMVKGCDVIGDEWKIFDKVRLRAITFDGLLSITDAQAFRTALVSGIGRGKAYGCGLLTIARVQT